MLLAGNPTQDPLVRADALTAEPHRPGLLLLFVTTCLLGFRAEITLLIQGGEECPLTPTVRKEVCWAVLPLL